MAEIALKSLICLHLMGAKNTSNFGGETLFPFSKWEMPCLFPTESLGRSSSRRTKTLRSSISENDIEEQAEIHQVLTSRNRHLDGRAEAQVVVLLVASAESHTHIVVAGDVLGAEIEQVAALKIEVVRLAAARLVEPIKLY